MEELKAQIEKFFSGDVVLDTLDLKKASHDWSLFEVMPKMIVYPRNSRDIQELVSFVAKKKKTQKWSDLSLTARAAGTDMSGGPLNDSIIIDVTRYMKGVLSVNKEEATLLPGTYYRDLETETDKLGVMMPCFPASKYICAVGGMVANNGAGELSLRYGQNKDWVKSLKVVLEDGKEVEFKSVTKDVVKAKSLQNDLEGNIYQKIWNLTQRAKNEIAEAKPKTAKNSSGYLIWDVWNEGTQMFDLTKLVVGAQGTTGIITEITYKLTPKPKTSTMMVSFLKSFEPVPELVSALLETKPDTLEVYDDNTLKFATKFFGDMVADKGFWGLIKFGFRFVPEFFMGVFGGMPKLIVLSEYSGDDKADVKFKATEAKKTIQKIKGVRSRVVSSPAEAEKYWQIRHDSFKLLTEHSKDKSTGSRTAPFIDDIVIDPKYLPEYLPRLIKILDEYDLLYTVAGHIGQGNLHIIPIMDFDNPNTKKTILDVTPKVYELVKEFHGSLTGEHNDGIIRTPYLPMIYGEKAMEIFQEIKDTFDPLNIFNPGKKVGGSLKFLEDHIADGK
ncbi:MAG: FAD/FMN-containing dehydrogenase [Candidatus Paceibacteria bacterium]|jgi:FAD/FMN-containing dehydrogenase